MNQPSEIPPGYSLSLCCSSETYHVEGCEDFAVSELLASSHPRLFNLSLPHSSPLGTLQAVPSALLRFAEEPLLGRAVSLHHCPLTMSSLRPRSPAQLSSTGPAQGSTFSALSGLPPGVPGAPGEAAVKEMEQITAVLSLSWGETLIASTVLSSIRKRVGHENHLPLSHHETGYLDRDREGSPLPLCGNRYS